MKRILTIATTVLTMLVVFTSCNKDKDLTIEKTWKVVYNSHIDVKFKDVNAFIMLEQGIFRIAALGKDLIEGFGENQQELSKYNDYLVIISTGTYTTEKISKTSGKIIINIQVPLYMFEFPNQEVEILYSELTKNSVTISIEAEEIAATEKFTSKLVVETKTFPTITIMELWMLMGNPFEH